MKISKEIALDVIARELGIHRQEAERYSHHDPIWISRMAATHVLSSLFAILIEAGSDHDLPQIVRSESDARRRSR